MSSPSPIEGTRRRRLWFLLRLGVASVILYYIFRVVPLADVFAALHNARLEFILLALPLVLLSPCLSAGRLKILTNAQRLTATFPQILGINFVSIFYGLALPGQLAGGLVRWHRLTQLEGKGAEPLAAIVYSRLFFLTAMCGLGGLFAIADLARGATWVAVGSLLALFGILGFLTWLLSQGPGEGWLERRGRAFKFLAKVSAAANRYRGIGKRALSMVLAYAVVENLVGTAVVYLLARAVEVDASLMTLGWVRAVVRVLANLPISIAGLGVREGSLVLALGPYGVVGSRALALSFLLLGRNIVTALVGGLLELRRVLKRVTGD